MASQIMYTQLIDSKHVYCNVHVWMVTLYCTLWLEGISWQSPSTYPANMSETFLVVILGICTYPHHALHAVVWPDHMLAHV